MLVSKILEFAREELAENRDVLDIIEKQLVRWNPEYDMTMLEMSVGILSIILDVMKLQKREANAANVLLISATFDANKNRLPKELVRPAEMTVQAIMKGFIASDVIEKTACHMLDSLSCDDICDEKAVKN